MGDCAVHMYLCARFYCVGPTMLLGPSWSSGIAVVLVGRSPPPYVRMYSVFVCLCVGECGCVDREAAYGRGARFLRTANTAW